MIKDTLGSRRCVLLNNKYILYYSGMSTSKLPPFAKIDSEPNLQT